MRLRDTLKHCKGKWLVSYNDCEYIRELYKGYYIEAVTRINNLAQRYEGGCEYPEVLISNYDTAERLRDVPMQIGLFDLADGFYNAEQQLKKTMRNLNAPIMGNKEEPEYEND